MKLLWSGLLAGGWSVVLIAGCSVLPTTQTTTKSHFTNYTQVEAAFELIVPGQTRVSDLKTIGFDPATSPNVKVRTYVEVINRFMPNPAITKADLPPGVRACIEAQEHGHAYEVELSDLVATRHGNAFLDVFGFKRRTHETGWRFHGIILTTNELVVYKLASGDPVVSTDSIRVKPLGPLQELDSAVVGAAARVK